MTTQLSTPEPRTDPTAALPLRQSIVVVDEAYAILAFAGRTASVAQLDFAVRHSSGLIFALLSSARLDQLRVPNQQVLPSEQGTVEITVAVDAARDIGTGISARDRAQTLRVLADPATRPHDLVRPGHILPIRCLTQGAPSHIWDRILAFMITSFGESVAGACHLVADSGELLCADAAIHLAATHDLPTVCVADSV